MASGASSKECMEAEGARGTDAAGHGTLCLCCGPFEGLIQQVFGRQQDRVDLEDPVHLAKFLETANIKLIRAEYLMYLVTEDRRLPRRQEAESENFVDRTGKTRSALVDHEEVQAWAAGSKEAIIASVSHAWEAREHPDPCGHQLEQVSSHASLFVAAFAAEIWLFFDYVSLFQFKRKQDAQEQSFRLSMGNMHAMYSHESTITFRVESLTPEHRWQKAIKDGAEVSIYNIKSEVVEPVPVDHLKRNPVPYFERGWCRAEVSWSCGRGDTAQHQRIDVENTEEEGTTRQQIDDIDAHLTGSTPVAPEVFASDMHSAAFTHRSDADAVAQLQAKVFQEKVTRRKYLKLKGIGHLQMLTLAQSLPSFHQLKRITLEDFRCDDNEAKAFVEALASTPIKKIKCNTEDQDSLICLVKAMSVALASNTLKITHLDLASDWDWARLGAAGAEVVAEALKENRTIQRLNLAYNRIDVRGIKAIAAILKSNTTLVDLDLRDNKLGGEGAEVVEEALKENRTIQRLNLARNDIGINGVKALQKALETNKTLEHLELDEFFFAKAVEAACRANPQICKPSAAPRKATDGSDEDSQKSPFETAVRIKGLADQLRLNQIVTVVKLWRNENIGDEQVKALADALRVNRTVTEVDLWRNPFGDEGLKALASAMEVNDTITDINLDMEEDQLTDEGRQAIKNIKRCCVRNKVQPVCRSCRSQTITEVDLFCRNIGDEHVKALADALRVNHTVTEVDLRQNKIGDQGLKALADALRVNRTVARVKLGQNKIGDDGVKALADALRVNSTVTEVYLFVNPFGDEGLKAMEDIERCCTRNKAPSGQCQVQ